MMGTERNGGGGVIDGKERDGMGGVNWERRGTRVRVTAMKGTMDVNPNQYGVSLF
jgi:hypothetical protein